jgi:uncharacterized membrane protein
MIEFFALIGLIISIYSYFVFKSRPKKRFCDFSKNASCSKAFKSKDSKLFFIHNSILGAFFYVGVLGFKIFNLDYFLFLISFFACVISVFLIYKLIVTRNFCIVCLISHLLNFFILLAQLI